MSRPRPVFSFMLNGSLKWSSKRLKFQRNTIKLQQGFTLIEVMIVVFIIGILAAITVPSYRRYVIVNAERETQAKMMQLQIELERWRSSALTYRGFIPQAVDSDGDITYSYADDDNTIINVPMGSGDNYTYRITLVDGDTSGAVNSLVSATGVDNVTGRTWKMLAIPNPNSYIKQGHNLVLTSTGAKCMTTSSITIKTENCDNDTKGW